MKSPLDGKGIRLTDAEGWTIFTGEHVIDAIAWAHDHGYVLEPVDHEVAETPIAHYRNDAMADPRYRYLSMWIVAP